MTYEEARQLQKGQEVWRSCIEFSRTGQKAMRIVKPKIVEVKTTPTPTSNYIYTSDGCCVPAELHYTEEDAIQHYRSMVYRTLDKLDSEYQKAVRYVKSKMI
ncbi:MAG: hypothetical protein J6I84_03915 [Bacilli bacterium]|nr:hypothetical protein [Bacilli bacterium]